MGVFGGKGDKGVGESDGGKEGASYEEGAGKEGASYEEGAGKEGAGDLYEEGAGKEGASYEEGAGKEGAGASSEEGEGNKGEGVTARFISSGHIHSVMLRSVRCANIWHMVTKVTLWKVCMSYNM